MASWQLSIVLIKRFYFSKLRREEKQVQILNFKNFNNIFHIGIIQFPILIHYIN